MTFSRKRDTANIMTRCEQQIVPMAATMLLLLFFILFTSEQSAHYKGTIGTKTTAVFTVDAFTLNGSNCCSARRKRRILSLSSPLSMSNIADNDNDDDDGGGAALAAEFSQFIKQRDEEIKTKSMKKQSSASNKSVDITKQSNKERTKNKKNTSSTSQNQPSDLSSNSFRSGAPPFSNRREVRVNKDGKPYDVIPTSSKSFLSSSDRPYGSFGSFDNRRDPNNNMLPVSRVLLNSDELRLVRRAEVGLIAQLVGGIALLFAIVAIGFSGGITDGSERFSLDDMEADMTPDYSIVTDGSDIIPEKITTPTITPSSPSSTTTTTTTPFDEGLWI